MPFLLLYANKPFLYVKYTQKQNVIFVYFHIFRSITKKTIDIFPIKCYYILTLNGTGSI